MSEIPEHRIYPHVYREEVLLRTDFGEFKFTWDDTGIRRYTLTQGEYDHVLHQMPDGQTVIFTPSYEVEDDGVPCTLAELLESRSFPVALFPLPDEAIINAIARIEAKNLQSELDAEFGEVE